jgi:hypothetical protein
MNKHLPTETPTTTTIKIIMIMIALGTTTITVHLISQLMPQPSFGTMGKKKLQHSKLRFSLSNQKTL